MADISAGCEVGSGGLAVGTLFLLLCLPLHQEAQTLFPTALCSEHTVPPRYVRAPLPLPRAYTGRAGVSGKSQNCLWSHVNAQAGWATSGYESASQGPAQLFRCMEAALRPSRMPGCDAFLTRPLPSPLGGAGLAGASPQLS